MSALPRLLRDRSGAMAVEAAILLPILLSMTLGAMEMGRVAWTQSTLNYAVQEAARCAMVQKDGACATDAKIQAFAAARAAPVGVPGTAFAVSGASPRCVTAQVAYRFIISQLTPAGWTINARACRT